MCTRSQLNIITSTVAQEAKSLLGDKLETVILYGSYSRGDYDDESDIDIMVRIHCPLESLENYTHAFNLIRSRLSLKNDITVSITLRDSETFNKFKNVLPFYSNIEREGIKIVWRIKKSTIKIENR